MTDRHPDDEALSAVLDGEGDDVDRTHAEGCAPCQARLGELRAVSRAVGAPVASQPAAAINAAVEAAMAEAVVRRAGQPRRPAGRPAGPRRSRRSAPRGARLAAIGAIVVAVAGIASLIAVASNHNATRSKTSSAALATAPPADASSTTSAAGAVGGAVTAPRSAAVAAPPDLGDQSDPAALAAALHALERQGLPGVATTILAPPACAPAAAAGAGLDPGARALFDAPLRWRGQDAEVLIFALPTAGGGQTAVVVAAGSCAVLASFPL